MFFDGYRVSPNIEPGDVRNYIRQGKEGVKRYNKEKLKCEVSPGCVVLK